MGKPDETSKPDTSHLWNGEDYMKNVKYEVTATVKYVVSAENVEDAICATEKHMKDAGCIEFGVTKTERKFTTEGITSDGHKCWYITVNEAARKIAESFSGGSAKKYLFGYANKESKQKNVELFDGEVIGVAFKIDMNCFDWFGTTVGISSWGGAYMGTSSDCGEPTDAEHINRIIKLISNEIASDGKCHGNDIIYLEKEE